MEKLVLEGHLLTRINLASDFPTGDFNESEIKDATMENPRPDAGSSEERGRENEGIFEDVNSEGMHLIIESEDHRADHDASNLLVPLHREEEGRAGLGQGHKHNGGMRRRRRRRRRATRRLIDRWVPDRR